MTTPPNDWQPSGWQDPRPPLPPKKSWPRRHKVWATVLSIVGVLVVLIIVAGALGSSGSSSPGASISSVNKTSTVSPSPSPAAPALSAGQQKFVDSVKATMRAHGDELTSSDAQLAAVGQQVCKALGTGVSQSGVIRASKDAKSNLDMSGKKLVLLAEKDLCRKYLPHVIERFSGSGIQNSAPFLVNSGTVTVRYSYSGCDGGYGNFIADLVDSQGDDQSIANDLGGGGHKTTTVYPQDAGSEYHLTVDGECSFRLVLISG